MGTINRTTADMNKHLLECHAHLHLSQAESLVGDGTNWYSPGTYVTTIDAPTNFLYGTGSLTYIGVEDIEIIFTSNVTFSASNAGVDIEMTGGINSTPDLDFVMEHRLTTPNDKKELSSSMVLDCWMDSSTANVASVLRNASRNGIGGETIPRTAWINARIKS